MDTRKAIEYQVACLMRVIRVGDDLQAKFGKWPHSTLLIDWVQTYSKDGPADQVSEDELAAKLESSYVRALSQSRADVDADMQVIEDEASKKRELWLESLYDQEP